MLQLLWLWKQKLRCGRSLGKIWRRTFACNLFLFLIIFVLFPSFSFACSERNPLQVDYIPYLDSLAEQVGARPNILWLLMKDPRLALRVWLGPCTSYQYRLTGPGQWVGARQAILTQWERVIQPFRTREVPEPETRPSSRLSIMVTFSGVILLYCCYNKFCI